MMVFKEKLVRVNLPHHDPKRWKRLQDLYQSLENIKDSQSLVSVLQEIYKESGHNSQDFYKPQNESTGQICTANNSKLPFSGLEIFLDSTLSDTEKRDFLERTLPFIASLASKLDQYAPAEGFSVSCQQKPCCISLDRKLIASILASGFLCALPKNTTTIAKGTVNFDHLYANFHRSELKDIQAAKLRCFLCYFERLALSKVHLSGELVFKRQVVRKSSLPSLADWANCNARLSPLIVEHHKKTVDSESTLLQVDFSNCFIGGGLLGNEWGQEQLRFCTSPELLVATMFMESMEDNETLSIKGAERFSSLHSDVGSVVQFAGDFHDSTEPDICGNLQKVVASVGSNQDGDKQNKEELVLRLLNQALVCFHSQGTACELIKTNGIDGMNGYKDMETGREDKSGQERYENDEDGDEEEEEEEESRIMYIDDERTDINGNIQTYEIDEFCNSLVFRAFKEAQGEIEIKSRVSYVHSGESRDMFENLMKKSVHEVFKMTPEKERKYTDAIINSPLIPKCLLHSRDFCGSDSPLVPSTPPSSPTKRSQVTSGCQSPVYRASPPSDEVRLGTTSFADSLAESLMSCVMLSSSLATSIATIASTPLRITSVAMETLQDSPVKKSRRILSSFLSPKAKLNDTSLKLTNGEAEFGLIDLSAEEDSGLESNPYMDDTSEEDNEARRRSLTELAVSLFEDFASKLANTIIESATGLIAEDRALECIDEEHEDDDDNSERDSDNGNGSDSSDLELDGDDNREEESCDSDTGGGHENEANNDKNGGVDNEQQFTDSDSEHDSECDWEGVDIDKEIEDRFYELDITDNEEPSNNDHPKSVTEMVDVMVKRLLSCAYTEAVRDLKEKAVLYGIQTPAEEHFDTEIENKQTEEIEVDSKCCSFYEEPLFARENGFALELFIEYAKDLSTVILQEALLKASKFKPENVYEQNIELCSQATKIETGNLYFKKDLNLENMRGNEEVEFEKKQMDSYMFKSDSVPCNCTASMSEEDLKEFADVLSSQLIETSVAIADAAISLRDESLSMRPIAIGNWCSGAFGNNPEMEAIIRWLAASVVGCPAIVYHTSGDERLVKFSKVQQTLRQRDWRVCDVMNSILRYCKYVRQQDMDTSTKTSSLFESLLEECQTS